LSGLPDNYRLTLEDDVPEGRACGNCRFWSEEKRRGDKAWCSLWEDYARGDHYCNAWQSHDEALKKHYMALLREAEVSLVPSEGMRSAAKRGLELYKAGRGGDGLVPATIADARKMARGEALSADKAMRMRAWFARHYVDKKPGWSDKGKETPGYVAHLLWGGDAGRSWANQKMKQMESKND
jgi:hypothetical protein